MLLNVAHSLLTFAHVLIAADLRRVEGRPDGKPLEPCFVHVYALGHAAVMKQLDKGLEFLGWCVILTSYSPHTHFILTSSS